MLNHDSFLTKQELFNLIADQIEYEKIKKEENENWSIIPPETEEWKNRPKFYKDKKNKNKNKGVV